MTQNCSLCDKVFVTKEALDGHLLNHQEKKTVLRKGRPGKKILCECSECKEVFYRKCDLRLHNRMVHQMKRIACNVCGRNFKTERHLKMHYQFHNVGGEYKCVYCSREFNKGWKLKIHSVNHTGKPPYICKYCDEDFLYPGKILEHLKKEHDVHISCKDCGLGFRTNQEQYDHICKIFECKDCSLSFCTGKELSSHFTFHQVENENLVSGNKTSQIKSSNILSSHDVEFGNYKSKFHSGSKVAPYTSKENKIIPSEKSKLPFCDKSKSLLYAQDECENYLEEGSKLPPFVEVRNRKATCSRNKPSVVSEVGLGRLFCESEIVQTSSEKSNIENGDSPKVVEKVMNITTPQCTVSVSFKLDEQVSLNENIFIKSNVRELSTPVKCASKNTIRNFPVECNNTVMSVPSKSCRAVDESGCKDSKLKTNSTTSNKFKMTKVTKPHVVPSRRHFIGILKKNPENTKINMSYNCNSECEIVFDSTKVNNEQTSSKPQNEHTSLKSWLTSDSSYVTNDFVFGLETERCDMSLDSPKKACKIEKKEYNMTFEDLCLF